MNIEIYKNQKRNRTMERASAPQPNPAERKVEYSDEFPNGIEDAEIIEDGTENDNNPETEHVDAQEARENLLRRHALQQNILEATTNGVQKVESIVHTAQDVKSAVRSFRLHARESRAQRRYERHVNKAENSIFGFRRRKFAAKAAQSKRKLDRRTKDVNSHDTFIEKRQTFRDLTEIARTERVNNNLEFLFKRSTIAKERRQRRRDYWESKFTLVESRQNELQEKRRQQAKMVKFRQATFANIKLDYTLAA